MINIDYKDQRSIHEQIESGIKELIVNKILSENERIPSVRELSVSLTVNPNTVQKAYKQLEADGYIYSVKGKGNFVSPVSELKKEVDTEVLYENLTVILKELKYLNEDRKNIDSIITEIFKEGK